MCMKKGTRLDQVIKPIIRMSLPVKPHPRELQAKPIIFSNLLIGLTLYACQVFRRLKDLLDTVESIKGIKFAKSEKYGTCITVGNPGSILTSMCVCVCGRLRNFLPI